MCRAVFVYELNDPDYTWLISTFQEERPDCYIVESACLPVVLLPQPDIFPKEDENINTAVEDEIITPEKNFTLAEEKERHRSNF